MYIYDTDAKKAGAGEATETRVDPTAHAACPVVEANRLHPILTARLTRHVDMHVCTRHTRRLVPRAPLPLRTLLLCQTTCLCQERCSQPLCDNIHVIQCHVHRRLCHKCLHTNTTDASHFALSRCSFITQCSDCDCWRKRRCEMCLSAPHVARIRHRTCSRKWHTACRNCVYPDSPTRQHVEVRLCRGRHAPFRTW
jgi:hypothetical protein